MPFSAPANYGDNDQGAVHPECFDVPKRISQGSILFYQKVLEALSSFVGLYPFEIEEVLGSVREMVLSGQLDDQLAKASTEIWKRFSGG